jgi:hypothetical protein
MRQLNMFLVLGLTVALMTMIAGCSSDSTAPQDTYDIDAATAEQWSEQALEMINQMAATVPEVSQGEFAVLGAMNKSATEPTWDELEEAWVMDVTESLTEGDPVHSTMEMSISVWIQFRNAEGNLPSPLGATEMEYRAGSGMVMDSTEEGTSHMEFDFETAMVVEYQETGYGVEGMGAAAISASQTTDQGSQSLSFDLGYGMNMFLPMEGCPGGTAWVTAGQYRTDAVYDGEGMVDWTLAGPNYEASGSDPVECAELPQ